MLNKHSLLFIALLCTTQLYAAVPIESRGLSQSSSYNNTSSTATPTVNSNPTWDLVQKNQNLENDIRTLRGQLEEQANEIDQLKKELTNRTIFVSINGTLGNIALYNDEKVRQDAETCLH